MNKLIVVLVAVVGAALILNEIFVCKFLHPDVVLVGAMIILCARHFPTLVDAIFPPRPN